MSATAGAGSALERATVFLVVAGAGFEVVLEVVTLGFGDCVIVVLPAGASAVVVVVSAKLLEATVDNTVTVTIDGAMLDAEGVGEEAGAERDDCCDDDEVATNPATGASLWTVVGVSTDGVWPQPANTVAINIQPKMRRTATPLLKPPPIQLIA